MVKVITRTVSTIIGRRPDTKAPRHRIGRYVPVVRSHPWFELRAQRTAELGQYR